MRSIREDEKRRRSNSEMDHRDDVSVCTSTEGDVSMMEEGDEEEEPLELVYPTPLSVGSSNRQDGVRVARRTIVD